jgi:hypothetical protein
LSPQSTAPLTRSCRRWTSRSPNDFNHLHFGAGQTEAKITLPLGKHTLRLLFADAVHVPHNPPVYSEAINVTVTESGRPPKKRYKRHYRWRYY